MAGGRGIYEYYRQLHERAQGHTKRNIRGKPPEGKGINCLLTRDGRSISPDSSGVFEVDEEDANPLYMSGWRKVS